MAITFGIRVDGLAELQRGLRKLAPEIDAALKAELKGIAENVAVGARRRIPKDTGRARASIRAGADARGPYVKGGKRTVPYYAWLEFGSRTPGPHRGPWRSSGSGPPKGRAIYPEIGAQKSQIASGCARALERAKAAADLA